MLGIRKIAVILILIGIILPVIVSLFCSGYSQTEDLFTNVQQMHLVLFILKGTERVPFFNKTLSDDVGLMKY